MSKAFAALADDPLTVIDDIGLLPISADAAEGLYRLVDAAYERRSLGAVDAICTPRGSTS